MWEEDPKKSIIMFDSCGYRVGMLINKEKMVKMQ